MINVTNLDYKKSCTEVLAILNNIPIRDFKKIPTSLINAFETNKDTDYEFFIDYSKDLKDQDISDFTLAILRNLYRDYWATEEERSMILLDEKQKRYRLEKSKKETYNPNDIFKKVHNKEVKQMEISENIADIELIEYKKTFFTRFKNFIFKILHINK